MGLGIKRSSDFIDGTHFGFRESKIIIRNFGATAGSDAAVSNAEAYCDVKVAHLLIFSDIEGNRR